ncbi:ankyrin repeat-containing domain protein [Pyronema domesticum]|nr:ankyrin repeat-containing domain protein [Pyronema domesticum]
MSIAALWGSEVLPKILLEKGHVNVNFKAGLDSSTPLCTAATEGHLGAVNLLLDDGAEADLDRDDGCTPLYDAVVGDHLEMVKLLLERGADVNLKVGYGNRATLLAARFGRTEVLKVLLERDDVEIDSKNKDGWTPLSFAVYNARKDITERLLEKGADVNTQDRWGQTPLMRSFSDFTGIGCTPDEYDPAFEIMKLLLAQPNIDVNLKDEDGDSALSLAIINKFSKMKEILSRELDKNRGVLNNLVGGEGVTGEVGIGKEGTSGECEVGGWHGGK